ncbi:hypothetical protein V2I01_40320 [Micromonospora sp. BRA006-A]|nr:hypothetical protein [Micromonospora sp. BRA006-A]
MGAVRVRFVGGPADELTGSCRPGRTARRRPGGCCVTRRNRLRGSPTTFYERDDHASPGGWTMRYVHTFPFGATE